MPDPNDAPPRPGVLSTLLPKTAATLLIAFTAWMAHIPKVPSDEIDELAGRFEFVRTSLNDVDASEVAAATPLLAPRFQHMEAYLTAFLPTGAALTDLDGNGHPDEACITDGFSRKVRVYSVRNPESFSAFTLPIKDGGFGRKGALPTGCLPGDYNDDGLTDVLVYFWGRTPIIYVNEGKDLSAQGFHATELVDPPQRWYTQSMSAGDIDGDGRLDLVVGNYFPDNAKILDDAMRKGDSQMNRGFGGSANGAFNRLLLGASPEQGRPRFAEAKGVFDALGGTQWTIATAVVDLDGDQLPEVFFLNDHGPDRILHNRTRGGKLQFAFLANRRDFLTPKSNTLGRDDYHAMGVDFGDLNRDGRLDWGINNFGADYLFHQSHFAWINTGEGNLYAKGQAPFSDQSETLGLSRSLGVPWDIRFADFDNDGHLEVFRSVGFLRGTVNRATELHETALSNELAFQFPEVWHKWGKDDSLVSGIKHNSFCVRTKSGRYTDIGGRLNLFEPGCSRGMASADVDGDGRIDFLVTNQRASSTFYQNDSDAGPFMGLDIRLTYLPSDPEAIVIEPKRQPWNGKSRPAIGAAVILRLPDGQAVSAIVDGGSGFGGKKDSAVHIGLGRQEMPKRFDVELDWRDAQGNAHHKTIKVGTGWHTVQLGS